MTTVQIQGWGRVPVANIQINTWPGSRIRILVVLMFMVPERLGTYLCFMSAIWRHRRPAELERQEDK